MRLEPAVRARVHPFRTTTTDFLDSYSFCSSSRKSSPEWTATHYVVPLGANCTYGWHANVAASCHTTVLENSSGRSITRREIARPNIGHCPAGDKCLLARG